MKKILIVALALTLLFVTAGCGGSAPAPQDSQSTAPGSAASQAPGTQPSGQVITMRLAEIHAADYPTTLGNHEFARLVEERTGGRIKIEVYPGGQLGDETAVVQELVMGTIEFGRVSVSPVTGFSPGLNAIMLPFMYRDGDHMWNVLNGPIGTNLLAQVESAGLVGLTWYDAGARNFYSRDLLQSLDDFAGVKFRMQDSPLMQGIVAALGGNPVSMGMGDVYGALQTGVVDGAENNIPSYESWSHYEVAPYYLLSGHSRVPEILMASKTVMDRLPAEDREIIMQAAYEAQLYQRQKWQEQEAKSMEIVKQDPNVTVTEVSPEEWQRFASAVAHLHAEFGAGHEALIEQIKNS